ncbi:MAG: hypothetical protein ACI89M_000524, partial [Chitinophagales bacterium]
NDVTMLMAKIIIKCLRLSIILILVDLDEIVLVNRFNELSIVLALRAI